MTLQSTRGEVLATLDIWVILQMVVWSRLVLLPNRPGPQLQKIPCFGDILLI